MRSERGFTLLELMISMAVLSVIAMLGFIVIRSSYESQSLIEAKGVVDRELRDVMAALTAELELAYTDPRLDSVSTPEGVEPVSVSADRRSITFYRPMPDNSPRGYTWAGPITFSLLNEDTRVDEWGGNAKLDDGEDTNDDGMLTRRIVRTQVTGEAQALASANNISDIEFELIQNPNPDDDRFTSLLIRIEASMAYGPADAKMVRNSTEARIRFQNAGAAS